MARESWRHRMQSWYGYGSTLKIKGTVDFIFLKYEPSITIQFSGYPISTHCLCPVWVWSVWSFICPRRKHPVGHPKPSAIFPAGHGHQICFSFIGGDTTCLFFGILIMQHGNPPKFKHLFKGWSESIKNCWFWNHHPLLDHPFFIQDFEPINLQLLPGPQALPFDGPWQLVVRHLCEEPHSTTRWRYQGAATQGTWQPPKG